MLLNHFSCTGRSLSLLLSLSLSLKVLSFTQSQIAYKFASSILLTNCLSLASCFLGDHAKNEWKVSEKNDSKELSKSVGKSEFQNSEFLVYNNTTLISFVISVVRYCIQPDNSNARKYSEE